MTRIFRAAGVAAACAALSATATLAAPGAPAQIQGEAVQGQAVQGQAIVGQAQPAAIGNAFAGLFRSAVAAIAGSRTAAEPIAAPLPVPTLDQLVSRFATGAASDREQDCLASAVYFESRGEPIEGQLAVAQVVINRAASGRYPVDLCDVITQHAQFSFVRHGRMPMADRASEAWRKAVAIAHIAHDKLALAELPSGVLWYHADYVSPSWGKRLTRQARIGLHIFYS
ncbi:MAG: cell wall hydrolase [Alphaproteobacteria bacterium]|nr:cell wall hydrolase [Alphaproteobacteria bacterium]